MFLLQKEIEQLQGQLIEIAVQKQLQLTHPCVIALSEKLDVLINQAMYLKKGDFNHGSGCHNH